MSKDVTFYFSTRNRNEMLRSVLRNLQNYCPNSTVLVGNCSSKFFQEETSEIIKEFGMVKEIKYDIDPGMAVVYSNLYNEVSTKYSVVWADDVVLLKGIGDLVDVINSRSGLVVLVALPMIDDVTESPSQQISSWPQDEKGCVLWMTPTGRCTNHSIVDHRHFKKFGDVFTKDLPIDNFFHKFSFEHQRHWPDDARIYHKRIDDETRINSLLTGDEFRYNVGHALRCGSNISSLEEREKCVNGNFWEQIESIESFEIISKLKKSIEGKRVCLIGPSSCLKNFKKGDMFDDYDVVCRVNHINPSEINCDYGSRTDIFFHTLDPRSSEDLHLQIQSNRASFDSIKSFFVTWYPNGIYQHYSMDYLYDLYFDKHPYSDVLDDCSYFISKKEYEVFRNMFRCELNSGMMAFILLLSANPRELYVSGFSFYEEFKNANDIYNCYYDGSRSNVPCINGNNPLLSHNQEYQKQFLKKILNEGGQKRNIFVDKSLLEILNIQNYSNAKE